MKRHYHLLSMQSLSHKVLEKIKNILRMCHCMFSLFLCSSINNHFGHCQGRDMGLSGNFGLTKPYYSSYVLLMNSFSASLAQSSVQGPLPCYKRKLDRQIILDNSSGSATPYSLLCYPLRMHRDSLRCLLFGLTFTKISFSHSKSKIKFYFGHINQFSVNCCILPLIFIFKPADFAIILICFMNSAKCLLKHLLNSVKVYMRPWQLMIWLVCLFKNDGDLSYIGNWKIQLKSSMTT